MAATNRERATRVSLGVLKTAILAYIPTERACPRQLSDLQTARLPYIMDGPLVDGWGSAFIYQPTPDDVHPFTLRSAGPDRIPGTADDLNAWATPP
jgi:carbohydrate-binding DOMON domain-containing protein